MLFTLHSPKGVPSLWPHPAWGLLSGGPEAPLGAQVADQINKWGIIVQTSLGPGSPEPLAGLPGAGGGAAKPLSEFSKAEDTGVTFPGRAGGGGSHPAEGVVGHG